MTEEKSKFLFSIIVPVYNTEKYVEKTLKSIYEAMDRDCEVIVVNDGSKDNSEEIIKKFINALPEEYKNNFVYVKKDNKGLADTKNVGIAKARGEFISVVDSDDYIDKNFYKIAREYVKDNDIIIYDLYVVFEKNPLWNYTSRACRDDKENFLDGLINGAMSGSSCNKIIKKELTNRHLIKSKEVLNLRVSLRLYKYYSDFSNYKILPIEGNRGFILKFTNQNIYKLKNKLHEITSIILIKEIPPNKLLLFVRTDTKHGKYICETFDKKIKSSKKDFLIN